MPRIATQSRTFIPQPGIWSLYWSPNSNGGASFTAEPEATYSLQYQRGKKEKNSGNTPKYKVLPHVTFLRTAIFPPVRSQQEAL